MDMRIFAVWAHIICRFAATQNSIEWGKILPDLSTICPDVNFCEMVNTSTRYSRSPENPCCKGCSCESNCTEMHNCCFELNSIRRPKTDCLFPVTSLYDDRYLHKYRFVIEEPYGGCVVTNTVGQERNATCSPEEKAAPWGNFFPVYSKKLNANFKNRPCALCHGADDIEEWASSFVYIGRQVDFIQSVTLFNEERVLWKSYLLFEPPNNESKSIEKVCYDVIDNCLDERLSTFYIPTSVQMTREEIIDACENGPFAPYINTVNQAYKNAFCAICGIRGLKIRDSVKCLFDFEGQKSPDTPFLSILDASYIAPPKDDVNVEIKTQSACYKSKHKMNESRCREPRCPLLQTRLSSTQCGYATRQTQIDCLTICLNLTLDENLWGEINHQVNLSGPQLGAMFEEFSPWSKVWRIDFVGILVDTNRTEFAICLRLNSKLVRFKALVRFITSRLAMRWSILVNEKISFHQEILKHGSIYYTRTSVYGTPYWSIYTDFNTPPSWKVLYFDLRNSRFCLSFNQMFMCEQIELQPDEFQLENRYGILYMSEEDTFLYPNEFSVLTSNEGSRSIRVCIKDSGYVDVNHSNGSVTRKAKVTVAFLFFLIIYLLFLNFGPVQSEICCRRQ